MTHRETSAAAFSRGRSTGAVAGASAEAEGARIGLRDVTKRFGEVIACDGVSLDIIAGEVHCLLGENGAGKSTIIGLLTGVHRPDTGRIEIDGEPAVLASPAVAIASGIGAVSQHSSLVPTMTVLENLMLEEPGLWLSKAQAVRRLDELNELLGARIDPRAPLAELGLGQRQQFEIARAMRREPRVLILDEPTSMLGEQEVDALLAGLRRRAGSGAAIVFVTHKLREALAVADRITVLRGGRITDRIARHEFDELHEPQLESRILAAMFGSEDHEPAVEARRMAPARVSEPGDKAAPIALAVEALTTGHGEGSPLHGVSFALKAGEVLGIAGIDGHGQRQLAEAIAGQLSPQSGRVLLFDQDITRETVKARQRLGVRYLTDDRLHEGIIGSFSVALNLVLKRIGERPLWRFGRMDRGAVQGEAQRMIEAYDIRTPSSEARAGTLSGGNIQKILLARELSNDPRVIVFHKPSHGLDLRTVRRVHEAIREFAARGGAALLISTEIDELVELSHRILVMSNGGLIGDMRADDGGVRERLGGLIAGAAAQAVRR